MKIIARHTNRYHETQGAIVELTANELEYICGESSTRVKRLSAGEEVNITQRWHHAMSILREAQAVKKLPQLLRAFADTLETLHPAIDSITDEVVDAEFEVTS